VDGLIHLILESLLKIYLNYEIKTKCIYVYVYVYVYCIKYGCGKYIKVTFIILFSLSLYLRLSCCIYLKSILIPSDKHKEKKGLIMNLGSKKSQGIFG